MITSDNDNDNDDNDNDNNNDNDNDNNNDNDNDNHKDNDDDDGWWYGIKLWLTRRSPSPYGIFQAGPFSMKVKSGNIMIVW